jgi:hypothetical protein
MTVALKIILSETSLSHYFLLLLTPNIITSLNAQFFNLFKVLEFWFEIWRYTTCFRPIKRRQKFVRQYFYIVFHKLKYTNTIHLVIHSSSSFSTQSILLVRCLSYLLYVTKFIRQTRSIFLLYLNNIYKLFQNVS